MGRLSTTECTYLPTSCNTLPHCPGGGGQCNSCNALPRCLGAVGIATSALQCLTAWGQWAVISCNALPHCPGAVGSGTPAMHCLTAWGQWAVKLLQCTASLPGGSGQWTSCNALPQCPGGSGQWNSCNALPHCLGAVGSEPAAMHCLTVWGSWQCNSCNTLPHCPGGGGQCNSCNALPRCLGAVGIAASAMQCLTAWGQWAVQLLQRTASLPWGSGQCNSCNALPHCLGAVGSETPAMHCLTAWGQWAVQLLQCTASPPGGSGQWNACNALPHCLGAVGRGTPAMHCPTAWGQRAVQLLQCTASLPWGSGQWTSCNTLPHCLGAVGSGTPAITGRTGLGGTGSPAQGVVGTSCKAHGEPSPSYNRAHRPGGDGESSPGGGRSLLPGPMGGHLLQRTGRTGPGGTGSPAQGVFGVPCQANGGPSSSENGAHRPGGDGEPCPGGVRILLPGQWGAIFFREPSAPAWGGRGVLPRGCSESPARPVGGHLLQRTGRTGPGGTGSPAQGVFGVSCQANGGPSSSENRAHRPGGGGESCPGDVRSLLPGQGGAIFFREPGAPARGGRGVLPRGCSDPPARAMGGHLLQRTGRTCPGGDGESCPGDVRSLLQGQWGAIFFREPGAPARGGRGVLSRGCSDPPARAMGGHLLQRTGRTSLGGTGSPAQGVFGVSCKATGGPSSLENRAHRPWGGRGVLPRGCSESPARPVGGHLL